MEDPVEARTSTRFTPEASRTSAPRANPPGEDARQSCIACRGLKRKCSKETPTCSLCCRVGRECEYPTPSSSPGKPVTGLKRSWGQVNGPDDGLSDGSDHAYNSPRSLPRLASSSRPLSGLSAPPSRNSSAPRLARFPAAWYIDSVATRGMEIAVPSDLAWDEIEGVRVAVTLDDAKQIAQHYFRTTHTWFPVVSLMRISRILGTAIALVKADTVAMFASMHLISQGHHRTHQSETHAIMYRSLKAALVVCEHRGQLTSDFLAATVLTGVYETAHGIYPAAYFTIGSCARTCSTLGLHDKRYATQLQSQLKKVDTWTEVEERRRLWWATLILDRYINIGFLLRPLCTPSIPANEVIPASDTAWDEGELAVNPLLVMSIENQANVSSFARTCQAAHLLGRVSQHVGEHPNPPDAEFHFQEAHQLQRAATALLSILQQGYNDTAPDKRHKLFSAMALCCSALLALYKIHSCIDTGMMDSGGRFMGVRVELQELAIDGFKRVSATILDFAEEIRIASQTASLDCISPLVFNALYQAAGTYAWYARENGNKSHLASLNKLRDVIRVLELRWQVASDYLELLKDTETQWVGGCSM